MSHVFFKWACSVIGCSKHAILLDTACFTACCTSCPVLLVRSCEYVSYGGVLIACLKFPPQKIKTRSGSLTDWLLLLLKAGQSLRGKLWKITRTIPYSRKSTEYVADGKTIHMFHLEQKLNLTHGFSYIKVLIWEGQQGLSVLPQESSTAQTNEPRLIQTNWW